MREFTRIHVSISRTKSDDIKYFVKMLVVNLSELKYIRNLKTNYGKIIGGALAQRATLLHGPWQDLPVIMTSHVIPIDYKILCFCGELIPTIHSYQVNTTACR